MKRFKLKSALVLNDITHFPGYTHANATMLDWFEKNTKSTVQTGSEYRFTTWINHPKGKVGKGEQTHFIQFDSDEEAVLFKLFWQDLISTEKD